MKSRRSPFERFATAVPAHLAFVALGIVLLGLSLWRFFVELQTASAVGGPMLAAWGNASLALVTLYVSYWLANTDFAPTKRWLIVGGSLLGLVCAVSVQSYIYVISVAEGRPIEAPVFTLVLVSAIGALAGAAIGYLHVNERLVSEQAREARDAMAFTNSLLRHDVRNGLQIVRGNAELAATAEDDRIAESGEAIDKQVEALDELIEEVRAVSDVLLDDADLGAVDLSEMLSGVVDTTQDSYPEADVQADVPESLTVEGTNAIVPVLTNLLNNSVQHNTSDATVRVTAKRVGDAVRVAIADDGPGVPPSERDRIFERGVTTDGGDGLGLHIVGTIVDRLGGEIEVADSDLGGATFAVEFPASEK